MSTNTAGTTRTNLIVARMDRRSSADVARLFGAFDQTGMPRRMGTRRRQLFSFHGLYFHLQDFADDGGDGDGDANTGEARIEDAKTDPLFTAISADLRPFIAAYDPATWRSPADAMARRFYFWEQP